MAKKLMKLKDQAIEKLRALQVDLQTEINSATEVGKKSPNEAINRLNALKQEYVARRDAINTSLLRDRSDPAIHTYNDLDALQATMNTLAGTITPLIEQYNNNEVDDEFFDADEQTLNLETDGAGEQLNPESKEHSDAESECEGVQLHNIERLNIPPQKVTATFSTAIADLNRASFIDLAYDNKFRSFIQQFNKLPEAQKDEPVVVNAMTTLFTYIETLSKPQEEFDPKVRLKRNNARIAFEAAIIDLPGHPNEFVQNIGMAFLGIAALITVALAAAPVLALFSISTAYLIPAASAAAATGLIGIFTLFGAGSAGAHRQALELSTATSNLDEQTAATTFINNRG